MFRKVVSSLLIASALSFVWTNAASAISPSPSATPMPFIPNVKGCLENKIPETRTPRGIQFCRERRYNTSVDFQIFATEPSKKLISYGSMQQQQDVDGYQYQLEQLYARDALASPIRQRSSVTKNFNPLRRLITERSSYLGEALPPITTNSNNGFLISRNLEMNKTFSSNEFNQTVLGIIPHTKSGLVSARAELAFVYKSEEAKCLNFTKKFAAARASPTTLSDTANLRAVGSTLQLYLKKGSVVKFTAESLFSQGVLPTTVDGIYWDVEVTDLDPISQVFCTLAGNL
jgi:hypothetical protein